MLVATAFCGIVQAVAGGQPLLIVGVAEPIVLTYKVTGRRKTMEVRMYSQPAATKPGLCRGDSMQG